MTATSPSRSSPDTHLRGAEKLARIPIKIQRQETALRKPDWIRIKPHHSATVERIKKTLRAHKLHSVCEEAACPNLTECFSLGTATFMILGDLCTRRCPFCDVAHGRPIPPDANEPTALAAMVADLRLSYVVITSVNRDDLRDGGATHFADCINQISALSPHCKIEILVPDFRGRQSVALDILGAHPPAVFNHNLETVPALYRQARPGANYQESLDLLRDFKTANPTVPTKSGIMLGLGETTDQVSATLKDLRNHGCDMLTLGQYLQPSRDHLPIARYLPPEEFDQLKELALSLGFRAVASGPLVRSSYHADAQLSSIKNQLP